MLELLFMFAVARFVVGYLSTWKIGLAAMMILVLGRALIGAVSIAIEYRREAQR